MTDNTLTVEALTDEIRRHVEWWYSADRLASDLAPFINRHIADRVAEAEPAGSETVAYTVSHVQGCTVVGYFLLEVETDNPPKTGDILYTRRLTGSKSDA